MYGQEIHTEQKGIQLQVLSWFCLLSHCSFPFESAQRMQGDVHIRLEDN